MKNILFFISISFLFMTTNLQAIIVRRVAVGSVYHPVARAVAVTGAVAVTAAAIGSIAHSVPPDCVNRSINGVTYSQCGSTWYQPQMAGSNMQYVVVAPPV